MIDFDTWTRQKGYSSYTRYKIATAVDKFRAWLKKEKLHRSQIRESDILAYLREHNKYQSQRTHQITVQHLKVWFTWQTDQELIKKNPAQDIQIHGVKRRHLYTIISPEALAEMHSKSPRHSITAIRDRCIIGLLVHQAIRTEELERLNIEDLTLREGTITIQATRRTAKRTLKLEPHQIIELMDYLNESRKHLLHSRADYTGEPTNHVFFSIGKSNRINNIISQLMTQLRIRYTWLTDLQQIRASVIVHWLKQHNLRKVQYMAGHRYVSSTEAYLQNDVSQLQEELNKYHPMI